MITFFIKHVLIFLKHMWFFSSDTGVTSGIGNPHGKWKEDSLGSQADLRAVQGAIFFNSLSHLAQDPSGLNYFIYEMKIIIVST